MSAMMMCRCRPCHLSIHSGCRDRFLVNGLAGSLFVWGGSYVHFLERFSPQSGQWDAFNMPHSIPRPSIPSPTAAVLDGCVYIVFGGSDRTVDEEPGPAVRFIASTEEWEVLPNMKVAHGSGLCAAMGGSLYVCGQHSDNIPERFSPVTGLWETLPRMSQQQFPMGMVVAL